MTSRTLRGWAGAMAVATLLGLYAGRTQAAIVERIVAVVGERPILLSDLRERARPLLQRVYSQTSNPAERAAGTSQAFRHTLETMIDEQLEQRAANEADITVTKADIDRMLKAVAQQNGLSVEELLAEAAKSGLPEQQYREELRRQTLALRLAEWRFQGRIRTTEEDVRVAYSKAVAQATMHSPLRLAWIVLPTTGTPAERAQRLSLVRKISEELAAGADFSELARLHSQDSASAQKGGLLPDTTLDRLPPALARALQGLEPGQPTPPLRIGQTTVIAKLIARAPVDVPTFEQARAAIEQQVRAEKMNAARQKWLRSLRRRTHVEVRL